MSLRVLVAGATGVIGSAVLPQLRAAGHHAIALVRAADRDPPAGAAEVVVADVLDADALVEAVSRARPDVVVDQIGRFHACESDIGLHDTLQLRGAGTRNLVNAARKAGARRVVAQSNAFAYYPSGHDVLDEDAPLWTNAPGEWGDCVRALAERETTVLNSPGVDGLVLRYGALYGSGTRFAPGGGEFERVRRGELPLIEGGVGLTSFTHVTDAASGVLAVLESVVPGTYHIVDNEPAEAGEWLPTYANFIGAPAPGLIPLEQAREELDWPTVHILTEQRGVTNFRIREAIGWRPTYPSWREGFAQMFGVYGR